MADAAAAGAPALVDADLAHIDALVKELEIGHVDDCELVAADLPNGDDGDDVCEPTPPSVRCSLLRCFRTIASPSALRPVLSAWCLSLVIRKQ